MTSTSKHIALVRALSDRERAILGYMARRMRAPDIASELGYGEWTVTKVQDAIGTINEKLGLLHVPAGAQRREAAIRLYNEFMGIATPTPPEPAERGEPADEQPAIEEEIMAQPDVTQIDEAFVQRMMDKVRDLRPDQHEFMRCCADGADPATVLAISRPHASMHKRAILEKLGIEPSRFGYAAREKLLGVLYESVIRGPAISAAVLAVQFSDKRASALGREFADEVMRVAPLINTLRDDQREVLRVYLGDGDFEKHLKLSPATATHRLTRMYAALDLLKSKHGLVVRNLISKAAMQVATQLTGEPEQPAVDREQPAAHASTAEPEAESTEAPLALPVAARAEVAAREETPPVSARNGHDIGVAPSGPGVAVSLHDPGGVRDVRVLAQGGTPDGLAESVSELRTDGFRPEVVVVYPTVNPREALSLVVMVKRTP